MPPKFTRNSMIKGMSAGATCVLLSSNALAKEPAPSNALAKEPAPSKPNIVFFLVDDMGLMDTSVPMLTDENGNSQRHALNDWYRTPNMEKLAKQGIRFSNFYAHSVCSPTRCSILTGQNSSRHKVTNWIHPPRNNRTRFGPPKWNWEGLTKTDITLPRLLQHEGYRTIHVGKGHYGPKDHDGGDPINLGFDRNIGGTYAGQPHSYYGKDNFGKGQLLGVPHLEEYHGQEIYLTEALTLEANKAVKAAVKADKPFFLNMCHYAVHSPFQPDPRFIDHYKSSDKSKNAKAYASMIEGVDKSLGDIITNLKQLGVAKNTLLVFFGDNGSDAPLGPKKDDHGYTSSAPLRGKKATHHEGGVRVPFICAWAQPDPTSALQKRLPIAADKIQPQMGKITDLMPTICNLAKVSIPDGHVIDGVDLKKQLMNGHHSTRSNTFLNHFPHQHRSSYFTIFIQDNWKVAYHYLANGKARYELYNLNKDPYETHNLAGEKPKRLKQMLQAMVKDLSSKNALYPVKDRKELKVVMPEEAVQ